MKRFLAIPSIQCENRFSFFPLKRARIEQLQIPKRVMSLHTTLLCVIYIFLINFHFTSTDWRSTRAHSKNHTRVWIFGFQNWWLFFSVFVPVRILQCVCNAHKAVCSFVMLIFILFFSSSCDELKNGDVAGWCVHNGFRSAADGSMATRKTILHQQVLYSNLCQKYEQNKQQNKEENWRRGVV